MASPRVAALLTRLAVIARPSLLFGFFDNP